MCVCVFMSELTHEIKEPSHSKIPQDTKHFQGATDALPEKNIAFFKKTTNTMRTWVHMKPMSLNLFIIIFLMFTLSCFFNKKKHSWICMRPMNLNQAHLEGVGVCLLQKK